MMPNFLSEKDLAKVDQFVEKSKEKFQSSTTENSDEQIVSSERTSRTLIPRSDSKFHKRIRQACCELMSLQDENFEIQVPSTLFSLCSSFVDCIL